MHVLVVDDDRAIRETLRLALEDEGYAVLEAANGLVALELLRSHVVPMVVLLDLRMPRLDGIEVLREVVGSAELSGRNAYALVTANGHTLDTSADRLLTHLAADTPRRAGDRQALRPRRPAGDGRADGPPSGAALVGFPPFHPRHLVRATAVNRAEQSTNRRCLHYERAEYRPLTFLRLENAES